MDKVKAWEEKVIIPTYEVGKPEKNPVFLEKRVYQGSCGKVYPYPVIESISDNKTDKEYQAVYLENEYLKVMILPELGGRIQRAYDKTNGYDFVYYNRVIKPALVGLTGPWISGGIEFNWPQHHRPTTFLPVDHLIMDNDDGSKSVLCHDVDQMYGTKAITKITLYKDKAYIEITGQLYNRTALPQTFLWWANPAVSVNEYTKSVFPPDVHAVMDHGKRDVSRFPIATGIYYKKDYSEGVDISRYKNVPVPTSYMAEKSEYDFVGGYDESKKAGLLHIADHHISPGKKQWTWGCGDFGKAWDKNLTDNDGPYIELMTGVFTDNQPDFTWLKPFEEKVFHQYFMPYKEAGEVKNANTEVILNFEIEHNQAKIILYGTCKKHITFEVTKGEQNEIICSGSATISPTKVYQNIIPTGKGEASDYKIAIMEHGNTILTYCPEKSEIMKLPSPAQAIKDPDEIKTNEELFLAGLHIEQYRHATYLPDPYYLEGLKRDAEDIRINNAYGMLCLRRGDFHSAKRHFETAIKRLTLHNPNPYDSEAYYNLGLAQLYLGNRRKAYDSFFKATWSNEQQEMGFYYLAVIDTGNQQWKHALTMVDLSLVKNSHNIKARALKVHLLQKLGESKRALQQVEENLSVDPFDFMSAFELQFLNKDSEQLKKLNGIMRGFTENYLMIARDYMEMEAYQEAIFVLKQCCQSNPLIHYYIAYCYLKSDETDFGKRMADSSYILAESMPTDYCFPNKLEDIVVLEKIIQLYEAPMACYYLGNLYYDKLQWEKSIMLWERAVLKLSEFPTVYRNLSLAYYNKLNKAPKAEQLMEKAFELNPSDARVFLELDQLYKKRKVSINERLKHYEAHRSLVEQRDDLLVEFITLYNMSGEYKKAYDLINGHKFHPWEGGEGKITLQYTTCLVQMALQSMRDHEYEDAQYFLETALNYPESLGEGKLEGTKDNHIFYYLGVVLEARKQWEQAEQCFKRATIGTDEPASMMYYNDQPADMILFQGLAHLKLGNTAQAKARFYRLIDYGEQHLNDNVKIEYFAVSLPDFLIFENDYMEKNKAHCYYLMALGYWGLKNTKKAQEFFQETLHLEPTHLQSILYSKQLYW